MTNEEIIGKIKENSSEINYTYSELLSSIDLTRADERKKVIGEIEEIVNGDIYTDEDGNNLVDVEKLRTKLNSLREAK